MTEVLTEAPATERAVVLGLGEWLVTADPASVLICLGLGSCVAICLHDPLRNIGGMAHTVLPDSTAGRASNSEAKFVDLALPLLLDEIAAAGGSRMHLTVDIVGGASMLSGSSHTDVGNVGVRNVEAARSMIQRANLALRIDETGGSHGRTVRLKISTGELIMSSKNGADGA